MSELPQLDEQQVLPMEEETTGYEVISSDEVDRTVASIEEMMSRIQSENIRAILDEAADEIYSLVYSESLHDAEAA
ncbi:hypothetical protein [Thalassoglobus polymorphus]|uniref:Uncharacterized protein n=1 Tax=Thalassoglobus polymorphus TaxID=2527994 RepID=A0A517QP47_9PLAN|nr:hypothetical protein [Thalassoglobus polymorphus]QDT33409.1 hypothetical protein Mal48_26620 [Thalassoglobus polymorphus]